MRDPATIMQALDTTIANIALPYIKRAASRHQDQNQLVLTSVYRRGPRS